VDAGDTQQAFTSMVSDLGNHPETQGHAAIQIGMTTILAGLLDNAVDMRQFILGFN
jgi:hypothetical protein